MRIQMPTAGDGTHQSPLCMKYDVSPFVQQHYIVADRIVQVTTTEEVGTKLIEEHDDVFLVSNETPEEALLRHAAKPMLGDRPGAANRRVRHAKKTMPELLARFGFIRPKIEKKPVEPVVILPLVEEKTEP